MEGVNTARPAGRMQLTYNFLAGRPAGTKRGGGVPSFYFINQNGRVINKTSPITFIRSTQRSSSLVAATVAVAVVVIVVRSFFLAFYFILFLFFFCTRRNNSNSLSLFLTHRRTITTVSASGKSWSFYFIFSPMGMNLLTDRRRHRRG